VRVTFGVGAGAGRYEADGRAGLVLSLLGRGKRRVCKKKKNEFFPCKAIEEKVTERASAERVQSRIGGERSATAEREEQMCPVRNTMKRHEEWECG
jgi:hypothetical protein